jgi:transcriptional regulator with XRE-family HTH domain
LYHYKCDKKVITLMGTMPRTLTKTRPSQGAHLAALRQAAGFSQSALAAQVGETQQNIAFWEQSDKPPRSDVLPKLARVLGVSVEECSTHRKRRKRRRAKAQAPKPPPKCAALLKK